MKKYYIGTLLLVGSITFTFAADLARYKNIESIGVISVTQPAIVQISNLDPGGVYIVTNDKGEIIQQQFQTERKTRVLLPQIVQACTTTCVSAPQIADANDTTTFDFPLLSSGTQKGSIKIVYAKSLETDAINFRTTGDSYMPNAFTLMIDGKRILNTIQGASVRFPKMMAQSIEIQFDYTQPIRFTEVGVGVDTEVTSTSMIRFVYQPGTKYLLYENSTRGREDTPTPAINLFAKNKEFDAVLGKPEKNPLYVEVVYKEKDSDGDSVLGTIDNCPAQSNTDQKDGNGNGVGDVCDDYDYDGVPTYLDNCPFVENIDQKDTDRDGKGDTCDQEESRFTEKHAWIPWMVFVLVFAAVAGMGYEVIRKKK